MTIYFDQVNKTGRLNNLHNPKTKKHNLIEHNLIDIKNVTLEGFIIILHDINREIYTICQPITKNKLLGPLVKESTKEVLKNALDSAFNKSNLKVILLG